MNEFEKKLDSIQMAIEERSRETGEYRGRMALCKGDGIGPLNYGRGYKAQEIIDGMKIRGYGLKLTNESETAYEFEVRKLPKDSYGMRLILQPETKEDVTEGLWCLIKTMEHKAKEVPKNVKITVAPSSDFNFGVEFRIEWE